ncbi:MAG TPA: hypothetical protein PLN85_00195 [archaeon]|nr:hypothetical protein [archaeon]
MGDNKAYICNSGGMNISGHSDIVAYGIQYRKLGSDTWNEEIEYNSLTTNCYRIPKIEITPNALFEYRAIVCEPLRCAVGNIYCIEIPEYCGLTAKHNEITQTEIISAGGCCIIGYDKIDLYGMEYEYICSNDINFTVEPINYSVCSDGYIHIPSIGGCINLCIYGEYTNTYEICCENIITPWVIADEPTYPSPTGINQKIIIEENINPNNQCVGCLIYTPTIGDSKTIKIYQEKYIPPVEINITGITTYFIPSVGYPDNCCSPYIGVTKYGYLTPVQNPDDEFCFVLNYCMFRDSIYLGSLGPQIFVYCNGCTYYQKTICDKFGCKISCNYTIPPIVVRYGDCYSFMTHAISECKERESGISKITIKSLCGSGYVLGNDKTLESIVCSVY